MPNYPQRPDDDVPGPEYYENLPGKRKPPVPTADDDVPGPEYYEAFDARSSRMGAAADFAMSRRKLLLGVLVVAGIGVAGYPLLKEVNMGTGGKELMANYEKIPAASDRHLYILKQVAANNMPSTWDDWVTIEVKSKKGTEVEFETSPHGLRVGTDNDWIEVPLAGPHAMAAAEIKGCTLPTYWMTEQIFQQAKKTGVLVNFYNDGVIANDPDIKGTLGVDWNALSQDGKNAFKQNPAMARARNVLVKRWMKEHNISDGQLTSCGFKEIVQPVAGLTTTRAKQISFLGHSFTYGKGKSNRLEICGGCYVSEKGGATQVQPFSGGHHVDVYYDYSHLVRFVKPEIQVNGKAMSFSEFFNNPEYALEFGFQASPVPERAYRYTDELAKWMRENGYLRSPLTAEQAK
ncbi:MAG: hypothetical protein ABIG80_04835 [Patescibacteria group bacterium]